MIANVKTNHARAGSVYNNAIEQTFAFLKGTARVDELFARSIVLSANGGYLLPLCELHTDDAILIAQLARWRQENTFAYPTQFPVTISGTSNWLRERVLAVHDRQLFLVVNQHGHPVGHLGLAHGSNDERSIDIDNVIRGEKLTDPGLMSIALNSLLKWLQEFFCPEEIYLRVFSDNEHAINFYRKAGFVDDKLLPLRRDQAGENIAYVPLEPDDPTPPDKAFLRMTYKTATTIEPETMILTAGPSISGRETSYAYDAARNGWNSNWSGYLNRFETRFAEYIGRKYALPVASGTGALHIALAALGIGPGDEIIVPDLTWVATANAVAYTGATPIFAEVEAGSWCLDADSFDSLITERTKAVIPVHLYGHPAHMDKIMAVAQKHNLYVIEDAAPAIGAEFEGRRVGTFGQFSAFSFQGAKLLVSGEGGMLLTDDPELYERAYKIWHIGSVNGTFWIDRLGWKYKLSNIQAAIGLGQLEHIEEMIEAKRRIFGWYAEGLNAIPSIK